MGLMERRGPLPVALAVAGVLILAGCGRHSGSNAPPSTAPIFFPTVPISDAYPAALIEGRLEERSGCLFVAVHDERWLLLWPEGYSNRTAQGRVEVRDSTGKLIGREGEEMSLGGGESRPSETGGPQAAEEWATGLTGMDIPERCGDLYWLVSPE
jgi:hypothetical protein